MRRANGVRIPRFGCLATAVLAMLALVSQQAMAGGPRFVTGTTAWVGPAQVEGWNTTQLLYYTDPGTLGGSVSHAQADAMVAAAAAGWNVSTSSLSLAQGGQLAEHVSDANSYFDGTNFVFPADVQASNESAVPVAVIYDTDGSVTDLLLGSGASEPSGCRQNAVTESVDDVQLDGHIHHALLILNGRCVGTTAEQMTQMQYQVMRAFGRVLGLAWSQTNDNVFTAVSTVTAEQEQYWPVMHPLDVICGTYTYQCMQNPFTLRSDDLNGLTRLYPVNPGNVPPGKEASTTDATAVWCKILFATGQGMDWVNVTAHRQHAGVTEPWELVSGVSGYLYQQTVSNPVTGVQAENVGTTDSSLEGFFWMPAVPLDSLSNVFLTSEAINPLYSGEYALGPYLRPPPTPSGSAQTTVDWSALPGGGYIATMVAGDGAQVCAPGADGSESAPAGLDPSGWQSGQICGWGHNSWWGVTVRAGRTWTVEVTSTDETGAASDSKLQPVVGVWKAADATGTLPTLASQPVPYNAMAFGMTQLQMGAFAHDTAMRLVVSDQFGAGRPDFTYTARVLYADAVTPAVVGSGGGQITITGMGFQQGDQVLVAGVAATVLSWTSTQIVAIAPARASTGAAVGRMVPVEVLDTSTGGTSTMAKALSFSAAADLIREVSAPASLETGVTTATPFAVEVLAADGVTAVAGTTVRFAVTFGAATLGLCGTATSCTGTTDSHGLVQTTVTGGSLGNVTVTATEQTGGASVTMTVVDADPVRSVTLSSAGTYVAAGAGVNATLQLSALQDGAAAVGAPVTWTASAGVNLSGAGPQTGAGGVAAVSVNVGSVAAGSATTVTGCVWGGTCSTWTVYGVDSSELQVSSVSGVGQAVAMAGTLGNVLAEVTDGAGHPVQGAAVTIYQRVLGWEGACTDPGRCPAAPVLLSSQAVATADAAGDVALTPLQVAGVPQTVEIALTTGTTGLATMTLVKTP